MTPPGEAVTMVTDYLLALVAFASAAWLRSRARPAAVARWWAAALAATGVAAVLGGTSHGYAPLLARETHGLIWRLTYLTTGLANFCILQGAARTALLPRWWRPATVVLLVRLCAVSAALIALAQFRFVLYDFALTLVLLAALALNLSARGRAGAGWVAAGVGFSAVGALVQLLRLGEGRAFNHNDVFHVVQAAGLICYARAGPALADARPGTVARVSS
jgi:uncharacterized protein DUF6962